MRLRALILAGVAAIAVTAPAHAAGRDTKLSNKVFKDYVVDGKLEACDYTTQELKAALAGVTPELRQYASDYPDALKAALAARARGECDPASAATPAPSSGPVEGAAPAPGAPAPPPEPGGAVAPDGSSAPSAPGEVPGPAGAAPTAAPPDVALDRAAGTTDPANDPPVPLIGLGILAALLALTAAFFFAVRRLGYGDGRLAPVFHSWREARWRAAGVWDDFADWLRVGR